VVDLGHLGGELFGVALREAAGHDQLLAAPSLLEDAISRMVSIDSFFASPMKPQVLTTMTSASPDRRRAR
jgi:hypothetical protein